jgi:hypothetical protein
VIHEDDDPWFVKKVKSRLHVIKLKQRGLPEAFHGGDEAYRQALKDIYSDIRETWERLVEEVLLFGVIERCCLDVKTQRLKGVYVDDTDYRIVFWQMKRASELSGHDAPVGKQLSLPDLAQVQKDIQTLEQYVEEVNNRRREVDKRRQLLERAPKGVLV